MSDEELREFVQSLYGILLSVERRLPFMAPADGEVDVDAVLHASEKLSGIITIIEMRAKEFGLKGLPVRAPHHRTSMGGRK